MALPRVLRDNLLLKLIEKCNTKNGLIIPVSPHAQKEYEVLAIGDEVKNISIGDILVVGYGMHEIVHQDAVYGVLNQEQVFAVLPKE